MVRGKVWRPEVELVPVGAAVVAVVSTVVPSTVVPSTVVPSVDPDPAPDNVNIVIRVTGLPGQEASQYPQASTPETWSPFSSTWVEHQGFVSPSMVVQPEMVSPPKLKGKTQEDPAAGPSTVMQL